MNKKYLSIMIVLVILLFIIFIGLLMYSQYDFNNNNVKEFNKPQVNIDKEKDLDIEVVILEPETVDNIGGIIKNVDGNEITIEDQTLQLSDDVDLKDRIVFIGSSTKIYLLINKTPEELEKARVDYKIILDEWSRNEDIEKGDRPVPPIPLKEKREGSLSNIRVGQQIMVLAEENIKEAKEFVAKEILVQKYQEVIE